MKLPIKITSIIISIFLTTYTFGQTNTPKNYLGVNQINLEKVAYNLVWSSHPSAQYYKQEFLEAGDTIEKFKKLILIDVITGSTNIKNIVAKKIIELEKRKKENPVINYETFEKNDEVMLDFLISQNTPDGNALSIIERNVYRYKSLKYNNENDGILLFGISERAYGDDIDKFFRNLKEHRFDLLNALGTIEIPKITIAN